MNRAETVSNNAPKFREGIYNSMKSLSLSLTRTHTFPSDLLVRAGAFYFSYSCVCVCACVAPLESKGAVRTNYLSPSPGFSITLFQPKQKIGLTHRTKVPFNRFLGNPSCLKPVAAMLFGMRVRECVIVLMCCFSWLLPSSCQTQVKGRSAWCAHSWSTVTE